MRLKCTLYINPVNYLGKLLQATDRRKVPFLDILIECDQKTVVSNAAVIFVIFIKKIREFFLIFADFASISTEIKIILHFEIFIRTLFLMNFLPPKKPDV